jgi:hypothetical protein
MQDFRFWGKEKAYGRDGVRAFLLRGWHDWRYKADPGARDEQSFSPVYEPIRDY